MDNQEEDGWGCDDEDMDDEWNSEEGPSPVKVKHVKEDLENASPNKKGRPKVYTQSELEKRIPVIVKRIN